MEIDVLHNGYSELRIGFKCENCKIYNRNSIKKRLVEVYQPYHIKCEFCSHLYYLDEQKIKEVKEKMKRQVQKGIEIPEGKHHGKILKVEAREKPYAYLDFIISVEDVEKLPTGEPVTLKLGFPDFLSTTSKLGKFIALLSGGELSVNDDIETDEFIGTKLSYMTFIEENDKGRFSRIVEKSIKIIE